MKSKVKLKDIASYSKGSQIKGEELLKNAEFDYLNGGVNPSGKWNEANCIANTIAISEGGNSCGYVNYMENPFWCGAHCYYLYDVICNSKYLYYALKSQQKRLMQLRSGACMPNIKKKDLADFELCYDNDEKKQSLVVSILDKTRNLIKYRKRQLEEYDELIKARFVEMFGDPITNPMRWEMVSIGDVVKEVKYGTSKPAIEGGKYPYLRMNNLTMDGHLDLSDLKFIDIPNDEIEKYIVRQGDVLFNRTNSVDLVGKTAVFDLPDAMIIAGYIIRIRLNERLLPEIFSQYMNLEALKSILKNMAKGAVNQANINAQELKKIKIYVPDIQTQRQFIKIKEQIDKSKFVDEKNLIIMCKIKRSLYYDQF